MASYRQMRLLVEPFLSAHPEFLLRKRDIFRVPIEHLMVGMEFERTGHSNEVALRWFISFLFAPPPYFGSGLSLRMDRSWGFIDAPDLRSKVLQEMETAAEELSLRAATLKNVLGYQDMIVGHVRVMGDKSLGLLLATLGEFAASKDQLIAYAERRRRGAKNWRQNPIFPEGSKKWEQSNAAFVQAEAEIDELDKLIKMLDRSDANGVATLLHAWEEMCVESKKLERYWMPSPFPFEIA